MTKTVYLSGLKYINCELTRVSDKRELGCLLFLWASKKLTGVFTFLIQIFSLIKSLFVARFYSRKCFCLSLSTPKIRNNKTKSPTSLLKIKRHYHKFISIDNCENLWKNLLLISSSRKYYCHLKPTETHRSPTCPIGERHASSERPTCPLGATNLPHRKPTCPIRDGNVWPKTHRRLTCLLRPIGDQHACGV